MNGRPIGALLLALTAAAPVAAQEPVPRDQEAGAQATAQEDTAVPDVLRAIQLPDVAEILRERGVPVEEIQAAIQGARARDVAPAEMTDVFEETAGAVEETGPIENFGGFVQARLADGLRGRELAEAIRAEHARRGIGQGRKLESRGRGQGRAGRGGAVGPDSMTAPDSAARPDSVRADSARPGPPMERGQRGRRPDSVPAQGGGRGEGGGQGGGQAGGQVQGGGQSSAPRTGGQR